MNYINHFFQTLLTSTSAKLAPFGHTVSRAVIRLPASWEHAPCDLPAAAIRRRHSETPHIIVENTPAAGPTGAQFGGCGVAGRALTLPLSLLDHPSRNLTASTGEEN